jgi:CubicO group peptidase (beta-lactamase class C family)
MRHAIFTSITIAALACSTPAIAAPPAPLAADASVATPGGATFTSPKAWIKRDQASPYVLDAPEGDMHVAIVDVPHAADATAAAAAAWAAYRPDAHRAPKLVTPRPPRQGWDERDALDYETSPNEKADVGAIAFRKGTAWTVAIIDGSNATSEKRGAAIGLVIQSLRPAGYTRESFAGRIAKPLDPSRVEAMRSFVATAIDELGVPGAGFALIDHGKLVYEGGVGVRELGKPDPVDAHTRFMVASNTKGMSTLLLSELVDAGKLAWDEPVTQVYPAFRLGSDATTAKVLVRNLVCACTGLPRKDMELIFATRSSTPASDTFVQLAGTEPTSGFGEVFQYNNLMASAAGFIGGHIVYPKMELGAAYNAAMQAKVFGPLGMTETGFSMPAALAADHASPHGDDIDGHPAFAPTAMGLNYAFQPYRPAGGAWSSAHDMIKYVQLEITQGLLPDGKRLVSAQNLLARRAHNVVTGEDGWYGMGLEDDRSWGISVIHHGGSLAGYKTDIMLVPDAQVGAVILTNSDVGQLLLRPFMRRLLEILYDGNPEAAGDVAGAAKRNQAEIAKERERLVVPPAPETVSMLAHAYTNGSLGRIDVRPDPKGTRFAFTSWSSAVASRKNDDGTTSFITIDPALTGFEFVAGAAGGKRTLTLRDGQHEYVFAETS